MTHAEKDELIGTLRAENAAQKEGLANLRAENAALKALLDEHLAGRKRKTKNRAPKRRKPAKKGPSKHGRNPLPEHLEREDAVSDNDTCGACGSDDLRPLGEETSEQLDYRPGTLCVRRVVRKTHVCRSCDHITTAEGPPTPIDKGKCTSAMLAHVVHSKYGLHLPLERQAKELQRQGVHLASSTLCGWMAAAADLLEPIVKRIRATVLASGVVQTDGTGLKVLRKGSRRAHYGQMAVFTNQDFAVYDYTSTKEGKHAAAFLDGFEGILVADAASVYDQLYTTGRIREAGCWAHALRKFEAALENEPFAADKAMGFIGRLYDVESDARERQQVGEVLLARRQTETRKILDDFKVWLDAESRRALPKSAHGKAVRYTRRHWDALNTFVDDPRVPPDNNLSERCLRTVAVGRNNYMFAGSDRGARTAATLYTVVMSCKMQGLDPYAYLADVFDRLCVHSTNRIRAVDIDTLLPGTWEPRTQQ